MHLGVVPTEGGIDVAVRAPAADTVELCVFDAGTERRHELTRGDAGVHHAHVPGIDVGDRYGFRSHGPWDPRRGLRHHPARLLVDPGARALSGTYVDHPSLHDDYHPGLDTAPFVPHGVVVAAPDPPAPGPVVPWSDTVVYETHVRGMTMSHPEVPPHLRGTYLGLASEPVIHHLTSLGITTVELMPVAHHVPEPFLQARGRTNYWGYSTLAWFAPHAGYATGDDGRQVTEFAGMVDAFHRAGLEVIVDVVFNHTAEGGVEGPVLSMKGLDNAGWYRLDRDDPSAYVDWTGTGNTVDTGSPYVRSAILECLRWWTESLGVDGFRFDLAVTLGRRGEAFEAGSLEWITEDPVVGATKLIAEPWDLGPGGYRLGGFGPPWAEWNGRFRDDLRDTWRGMGTRGGLVVRLSGSPDLFSGRTAGASVNFVTAHDGFTLADLVAYDHKHTGENGEGNRDGHDDNRSWNSGVEGPTDDPEVCDIRRRRSAALLASLFVSRGVPMILGGDELGRSQGGNNNAYALDGATTWFDWSRYPHVELIAAAAALRRRHRLLRDPGFLTDERSPVAVRWFDDHGEPLDAWDAPGPALLELIDDRERLVVVINPTPDDRPFHLPIGRWTLELSTHELDAQGTFRGTYPMASWSLAVLLGDRRLHGAPTD